MMDRNYNMTLLAVLIGLAPACNIGDKNLGETDDGDSETTDPDSDSGPDLPGQEEQEEGETEGEPTTCGNGIEEANELCFELTELPVSGTALDVYIIDVDAGGENSLDDIVVLTNSPEAPLLIWHNDPDDDTQFETEPEIVAGQLPPATIPGLEIGDFDPLGIEYRDIAYASADGVVIGWDNGTGDENGFDELTLIECANPISFEVGGFDSADGADFLCAHEADGGGIEVLLASHLGGRSFAPPIPVASDLAALSPLRGAIDFSGATIRRRFIAHDRVDELIVWELAGDEYVSTSYSAPAVAWDLGLMYLTDGL